MTRSMIRLLPALLLSGLVIAAVEPTSEAGTLVHVSFSGSGFSGWFQYDQAKPMTHPGIFVFTNSGWDHEIDYDTGGTVVYGANGGCDPFTITTSGNFGKTFQLVATAPAGATVTITLNTSVPFIQTRLPTCAELLSHPVAGSTFALSGGPTRTITALSCTTADFSPALPSPQSATPVAYFTESPAPTCPVYVCQPRLECCLSRLFSRCSVRARCW
jgi:hypothetical protein